MKIVSKGDLKDDCMQYAYNVALMLQYQKNNQSKL